MTWLDSMPWSQLIIIGGMLALAPFVPEPHLVEKLRMLVQGSLKKPVDIFDLIMHGSPIILVAIKAVRQFVLKV